LSNVTKRNVNPLFDKLNSNSWLSSNLGIFVIPKRENIDCGSSSNNIALAKPCQSCQNLLRYFEFKNIIYTDNNGNYLIYKTIIWNKELVGKHTH
jgi:hypothetical protein